MFVLQLSVHHHLHDVDIHRERVYKMSHLFFAVHHCLPASATRTRLLACLDWWRMYVMYVCDDVLNVVCRHECYWTRDVEWASMLHSTVQWFIQLVSGTEVHQKRENEDKNGSKCFPSLYRWVMLVFQKKYAVLLHREL